MQEPKQGQNHKMNLQITQILCYIEFGIGSSTMISGESESIVEYRATRRTGSRLLCYHNIRNQTSNKVPVQINQEGHEVLSLIIVIIIAVLFLATINIYT